MKMSFILIFFLFWYNSRSAIGTSRACMNREYKPFNLYSIWYNFDTEYSVIYNVLRKLRICKPKMPSKKEENNRRQICACVIVKMKNEANAEYEANVEHFNEILSEVEVQTCTSTFRVSYYFFMRDEEFPAYVCNFEGDEFQYVVTKGPKKQSSHNEVYNLYVGTVTGTSFHYKGIIANVDVELSATETPTNEEPKS